MGSRGFSSPKRRALIICTVPLPPYFINNYRFVAVDRDAVMLLGLNPSLGHEKLGIRIDTSHLIIRKNPMPPTSTDDLFLTGVVGGVLVHYARYRSRM
jgi:hypothetical protein